MTSSKISDLTLSVNMERKVMGKPDAKKTEEAQAFFATLMNQSSSNLTQNQKLSQGQSSAGITGVDKKNSTTDYSMKEPVKGTGKIKPAEKKETVAKDEISDQAEKVSDEITNVIKEEFDVTDEELEAAMEKLGLSVMDLLIPANFAELAAELTGSGELSGLLMNDAFTNAMQGMAGIKQELAADLGISVEEMQALLTEMNASDTNQPEMILDAVIGEKTESTAGQAHNVIAGDFDAAADDEMMRTGKAAGEAAADLSEEQTVRTAANTENTGQSDENADADADSGQEQMLSKQNQKTESSTIFAETNVQQGMRNNPLEGANLQQQVPEYRPVINVADIINQISEYTRISITPEITSLEMQLNPENLGKVYLQISTTKEGNISAQFAAQNQVVKEALEAQVAELRQNLNQQGVKVDAIEVTVSTHAFEQNLEQGAQNEEQQAEQREAQQHGRRGLNLNHLDELSGLMSEEEMLAAKIMQENGNTMDVIA